MPIPGALTEQTHSILTNLIEKLRQSPYDAVLFDFDGVVADTEPLHYSSWRHVLRQLGVELTWEQYLTHAYGKTDEQFLRNFASLAGRVYNPEEARQWYGAKQQIFLKQALSGSAIPEPVRRLIRNLPKPGAIVTSSPRSDVEPLLKSAGIFDAIRALVTAESTRRHKPAPDPYLLAAQLLGAQKPLVVEDSDAGVAAGLAAGYEVIRVRHPGELVERLYEGLPHS